MVLMDECSRRLDIPEAPTDHNYSPEYISGGPEMISTISLGDIVYFLLRILTISCREYRLILVGDIGDP